MVKNIDEYFEDGKPKLIRCYDEENKHLVKIENYDYCKYDDEEKNKFKEGDYYLRREAFFESPKFVTLIEEIDEYDNYKFTPKKIDWIKAINYFPDGNKCSLNDYKIGLFVTYYRNGQIASKSFVYEAQRYRVHKSTNPIDILKGNDKRIIKGDKVTVEVFEGYQYNYYKNGNLESKGLCISGKKEGEWMYWLDENDTTKLKIENYQNGELISTNPAH